MSDAAEVVREHPQAEPVGVIMDADASEAAELRRLLEQQTGQHVGGFVGVTLLGLRGISKNWRWNKMSALTARDRLDDYITLRGAIAHRLKSDDPVYKSDATAYLNHVQRLVEKTDDAVATHVEELVGKAPW